MKLQFPNGKIPFKRCITFHAHLSRDRAIKMGWIRNTDMVINNCWSDIDKNSPALQTSIRAWLSSIGDDGSDEYDED